MQDPSFFTCPLCGGRLSRDGQSYRCPQNHGFDLSKEGYLHLLPAQKKHSKVPGDTREMVAARRDFLESGAYQIFSDKLNGLTLDLARGMEAPVILDAGCGEGYYTGRLFRSLQKAEVPVSLQGFDISKWAVKYAAKRYRSLDFAVASAFDIPAAAESVDLLVNVFAPMAEEEYYRVLKPGGWFLFAVPRADHLWGLKEVLYEKPYRNEVKDTAYPGFLFRERIGVSGNLALEDAQQIQNLFSMTPYYWKTGREGSGRLAGLSRLETPIGFDFLIYQKER